MMLLSRWFVWAMLATLPTTVIAEVGYFSPSGISAAFAPVVDSAMLNADPDRLRMDLATAYEHGLTVHLTLTGIIKRRPASGLPMSFRARDGAWTKKQLPAAEKPKVFDFRSDDEIVAIVRQILAIAADYPGTLGAVFLVDEPYLNGVSRSELERVGALVRHELDVAGMGDVSIGAIFAGAMFNTKFATMMNSAAFDYVEEIDGHMASERKRLAKLPPGRDRDEQQAAYESWLDAVRQFRLVTYDQAGSMYTGGGIPDGFDIIGFDLYLSTVLLDGLYEHAISWLARSTDTPACDGYEGLVISAFKRSLSFFQDGPLSAGDSLRPSDAAKLDKLYDCRVEATIELLRREVAASGRKDVELLVVTESSANGLLEFDSSSNVESGGQPQLLIKDRVVDEVKRALRLYAKGGIDHLLFFTFGDEYDKSIGLLISGVSSLQEAQGLISAAADRSGPSSPKGL